MVGMSKNKFQSLFKEQTIVGVENSSVKTLVPKIPFYGIKGTICTIEETPESYYKVLYSDNGKIDPVKKPVPKKKGKNLFSITDDYYQDLKKYLDLNNSKYLEIKNSRPQKYLSKQKLQICLGIVTLASLVSLPVLFLTAYVGAILEAISLVLLYKLYDTKEKVKVQEEKQRFIKEYDIYQRTLVEYMERYQNRAKNNTVQGTTYTKIATKEEPIRENERSKVLTLVKDESREAA